MLTEEDFFKEVVDTARGDIRDFFDSNFYQSKKDRDSLISHLRQIDPRFFNHTYNNKGSLKFAESLLSWLEETRDQEPPAYPWEQDKDDIMDLSSKEKNLHSYLIHLEQWINRLILPGEPSKDHKYGPLSLGFKLWEFKEFICEGSPISGRWKIVTHSATEKDKQFLGDFVSWLLIIKDQNTIHIVYNKEKIFPCNNSVETALAKSTFRRVFLHELGHARRRLKWYLEKIKRARGTTFIPSIPLHEYEAWLYSITIRTLLMCIRSRITRFTKNVDHEWLTRI